MLDAAQSVSMQRMVGRAAVGLVERDGKTSLSDLHQSGSAKVMLPQVNGPVPEVVLLNTAGGITGGDRLDYNVTLGPRACGVATTQTAERAYRSSGGAGHVETRLQVGAGAALDWLPQETILFDGSNLRRDLRVDLAADARFLFVESLILGRHAMGEALTDFSLLDRRQITRSGRLIYSEPLALGGEVMVATSPALLSGAVALATIGVFAPDAEDKLAKVRSVLTGDGPVRAAASAWGGKLIARFASSDAFALRKVLVKVLAEIRGCPPPRVWQI